MILYESPVGGLLIKADNLHITDVIFYNEKTFQETNTNAVIKKCVHELDEYFKGRLRQFTVPLKPGGTAFRMRVWDELLKIPYGETISYKQLATAAGNPKAARAVGGANHHNPIVILIPCHRVIGSDGKLTGFGGGLETKEYLLNHEKGYNLSAPIFS
jgi:methylated-DNA-[protein]-cysteine S-methyltransferase